MWTIIIINVLACTCFALLYELVCALKRSGLQSNAMAAVVRKALAESQTRGECIYCGGDWVPGLDCFDHHEDCALRTIEDRDGY